MSRPAFASRKAGRKVRLAASLVAAAAVGVRASGQEVPAYWVAPVSGNWGDGTKWSIGKVPYNPNGVDYHAIVDAIGSPYTVTVASYANVGRVTLNSADAVLVGGMDAREVEVLAGTWRVPDKSTISHARLTTAGTGRIEFAQGSGTNASTSSVSLSNVTVASDLTMDGVTANVLGALTLDNATLRLGRSGTAGASTALTLGTTWGSGTIDGTGTVVLSGTSNTINTAPYSSTGKIGADVTIRPGEGVTSTLVNASGGNIQNDGTILADRAGYTLTLSGGAFNGIVNQGTIRATAGTLVLERVLNNGTVYVSDAVVKITDLGDSATGRIVLDNAQASIQTLNYSSPVPIRSSTLNRIERTGGTLTVDALVDNRGETLDLSRFTSFRREIDGGTVVSAVPDVVLSDLKLVDVTIGSDLNVTSSYGMTATGSLTLDGGATLRLKNGSYGLTGGANLRGHGRLVFASNYGTVTPGGLIEPGVEVVSDATLLTVGSSKFAPSFTNQGTLTVNAGKGLAVYGDKWANQGVINVGDGATMYVMGLSSVANLGTVNRGVGSTVVWAPTLDATGTTIDLNAGSAGPLELGGATLTGGTLTAPGRVVNVYGTEPIAGWGTVGSLGGVTVGADLDFQSFARFNVKQGLTLGGKRVRFAAGNGWLNFNDVVNGVAAPQTLGGTGEIVFDAGADKNESGSLRNSTIFTSGPLTIGAGVTVRTGSGVGLVSGAGNTVVNEGTISARGAGRSITLNVNLDNRGTVEAVDGATIGLVAPFANTGTIRVTDSTLQLSGQSKREVLDLVTTSNATVELTGTYDNTGRTLEVNDVARGVLLKLGTGGSIAGGTVVSTDGTPLRVGGNVTLSTPLVEAPMVVAPGASLGIGVGATARGAITLEGNGRVSFGGKDTPVVHAGPGSWVTFTSLGSLANIELNGANLGVYGTQTTALVRTLPAATNAAVWVSGTVNNTGDTLVTGAGGLDWNLSGGKITGGRIEAATATSVLGATEGTLENVTVAASITNGPSSYATYPPGLTIAGTFAMEPNRGAPVSMTVDGQVNFASGSVSTLKGTLAGKGYAVVNSNARVTAQAVRDISISFSGGGTFALMPTAEGGTLSRPRTIGLMRTGATTFVGTFDVADVPVIAGFAPYTRLWIASAYAGGTWSGPSGLTSSYAATHPGTAIGFAFAMDLLGNTQDPAGTILGETVGPTATYIRLTQAGDANLDGVVNFNDLLLLAKNYGRTVTFGEWYRGDFNYDGVTNFDDLLILAKNYGGARPEAPWGLDSPAPDFAADAAAAFDQAAVPEPAVVAGGAAFVGGVLAMRRRGGRRAAGGIAAG